MELNPENFRAVAREEIGKEQQRDFVVMVGGVFNYLCNTAMDAYGDQRGQGEARELGGRIREQSLAFLPALLEEFERNATRNGIKVLWAENGAEACATVKEIAIKHKVKLIAKGKSMLSEEIGLNRYLEQELGVTIYEGDLGELIVQQRGTMPFHIVGPAINMTVQEIAAVLDEHIDMPYTENAPEIAGYVRGFLREQFERADMGITGVNQAVASSGSLILVENEGNIRWVTSAPRVHVALMSIEKVCADMADALHLLGLLTRNCTGQAITSYVSILNGPRREGEVDGPEEMYVIIVDNGRSKAYQDPELKEALRCIRCGRCGIQCPVYLRVGAYPYGCSYPGPMGVVLAPILMGLERTRDLYEACTLCGACQAVCPTLLPHVDLFMRYRAMRAAGGRKAGVTGAERLAFRVWRAGTLKPRLFGAGVKLLRRYLARAGHDGRVTRLRGPLAGWFACRDMPVPLEQKSFRERWSEGLCREAEGILTSREADGKGERE